LPTSNRDAPSRYRETRSQVGPPKGLGLIAQADRKQAPFGLGNRSLHAGGVE
jgi:hypothetical protein